MTPLNIAQNHDWLHVVVASVEWMSTTTELTILLGDLGDCGVEIVYSWVVYINMCYCTESNHNSQLIFSIHIIQPQGKCVLTALPLRKLCV